MGRGLAMAAAVGIVALGLGSMTLPAPAATIGLCSCCLQEMPPACSAACAAMPTGPAQCPAFVIYDGAGAVGPNGNPLNAMSLKELSAGHPPRASIEQFRRFLEKYRRQAILDWRKAAWAFDRNKMPKADLDKATALYREALVNYYHGIHAYRRYFTKAAP
jgi:hypothetical protein